MRTYIHNMEEGGEKCKCNEDHLATANDTKRVVENNRQWLVCGFNGFGQFKFENKRKLQHLEELIISSNNAIVACSWTCLAIADGCNLKLQGFCSHIPNSAKYIKTETRSKSIAICDKYCLILLENGKVYKILNENPERLEQIVFQRNLKNIMPQKRNIFGNFKSENSLEIAHIACGNNIAVAISKTNEVFNGVTEIYKFPNHENFRQLVCGVEHALLLTTNGDIYAWGNGLRGQLGLGILRTLETPELIEALAGVKITYIAAGGWHSAAISAFGDIYTWGFNSNGQLGLRIHKPETQTLKEPIVYPLPEMVELPVCRCSENKEDKENSCSPLKVVAGGRHTIMLMSCGSVFASGWNKFGQLGLEKIREYCDTFSFLFAFTDKSHLSSKQIICGNWCTLIEK